MEMSLISAGVGLMGAIIGGTITATSNWVVCHRKEVADDKREKSLRDAHLRVASREVGEDLIDGATVANLMMEERCWKLLDGELDLNRWKEHRTVLAAELSDTAWVKVTTAISAIEQLRRNIRAHNTHGLNPQGTNLHDPSEEEIRRLVDEIERGRRVLKVYRNAHLGCPGWSRKPEQSLCAALHSLPMPAEQPRLTRCYDVSPYDPDGPLSHCILRESPHAIVEGRCAQSP